MANGIADLMAQSMGGGMGAPPMAKEGAPPMAEPGIDQVSKQLAQLGPAEVTAFAQRAAEKLGPAEAGKILGEIKGAGAAPPPPTPESMTMSGAGL